MIDLEPLVQEEIEKLDLPEKDIRVNVQYYPASKLESYYPDEFNKESYIIQINIVPEKENTDCAFSHLDFWYIVKEGRIEIVDLLLQPELRNKRLGRKMVKAAEEIGRKLSCNVSRIRDNENKPFWQHMGYEFRGGYWEKKIE